MVNLRELPSISPSGVRDILGGLRGCQNANSAKTKVLVQRGSYPFVLMFQLKVKHSGAGLKSLAHIHTEGPAARELTSHRRRELW